MDKISIDKLVKRLGMQEELKPILESTEGHKRFENGIKETLDKNYPAPKNTEILLPSKWKNVYIRKTICWGDRRIHRKVGIFKKYYGIGCNPSSMKELVEEYNVTRKMIYHHIGNVTRRLRWRRKEIWYNSL